ncbi:hypothetical protein HPP92_009185 [Vanilla planifolia]|uniref:Polygalacturonase n=1 Tax=Vanilla planifolia TaxID=51239 RepID=A0A835R3T2_VANPL|nr:hypothetical protein HPP92_009185 [Vanilla planifolia]
MVVPKGTFFVSRALLQGPCNNNNLRVFVQGTIIADAGYSSAATDWITFKYVQGLSVYGGTFDGRGQSLWARKAAGRSCPTGSTPGVTVEGATITAPEDSPNTDGIHLHMSRGVSVTGSTMRTGDDCISIGQGVSNVWIENIKCGPGHGISIGSLGASPGRPVQNVTASLVVFTGTQIGFRVKTWANPYAGFVKDVTFEHATMNNVQNPIVIDQNYCPGNGNCPNKSSGIKISGVTFSDVQGTSATLVAVTLDCSRSNPYRDRTEQHQANLQRPYYWANRPANRPDTEF